MLYNIREKIAISQLSAGNLQNKYIKGTGEVELDSSE